MVASHTPQVNQKDKILFVEDEKDLRDTLKEIFGELGFEVEVAENGARALEKMDVFSPDVVISDVAMPILDGYELLKQIKASPKGRKTPVILLTAKAAYDEKINGLELGADGYVTKPFDYRELRLRIENVLKLKSSLSQEEEEATDENESHFLKIITHYLDENMRDGRLELKTVANNFRLSPSGLQKKIKRLTDKSYSRFVREYRLRRAHELLESNQYTIGEVATLVGFATNSYFSESFRELYGYVPSKLLS